MVHFPPLRSAADVAEADRLDPLAPYRDQFLISDVAPIYLDGNSLGRQPRATAKVLAGLLDEWARDLVGAWERWAELPAAVGDRVGQLVGAAPGQIVVSDSTTVNLYKLAVAAVDSRPRRPVIIADANDFPTVRYVLQGIAARSRRTLRLIDTSPLEGIEVNAVAEALSDDVGLVCFSAVNYRSGAVVDMAAVDELARHVGALTLWDLSHAAGVVPVELDSSGADLAVGCGYKYLNGGPGAPAWLYVRAAMQAQLRQPIWGWWGQQDQFAMAAGYDPMPTAGRFLAGTPAVAGILALDTGIAPLLAAGLPALWHKTRRLVGLLADRTEALLAPLGARRASPSDPARRGGHFSISHPDAGAVTRTLIDRRLVVPDFRMPDVIRLAPVALYTSYREAWDAVDRIAAVLADPSART
ncbi:MAG TPA: aminotransferase class V-fold PLP-dependent enzyme [Acidimicrobiales bacterium]|nr:aminotransferase class V-fold PLP-dependent enzyme [Acidimicrobiales bacterium]